MITRLKSLREDNDLLLKQISIKLNIPISTYQHYESGDRDIPTDFLKKIADFYNVSVDYILMRTDKQRTNK